MAVNEAVECLKAWQFTKGKYSFEKILDIYILKYLVVNNDQVFLTESDICIEMTKEGFMDLTNY